MRIEMFGNEFRVSAEVRRYAEPRVPRRAASAQWLAECVWETEGGRVRQPRPVVAARRFVGADEEHTT